MSERYDAAEAAMDQLHERIKAARLDLLLIVGDDQTELFHTSNNPAIAIYYGATIRNTAREPASPSDSWVKSARRVAVTPSSIRSRLLLVWKLWSSPTINSKIESLAAALVCVRTCHRNFSAYFGLFAA